MEKRREIDLLELWNILWAKKVRLIKWGFIGAVTGIVIAFSIPKEYSTEVLLAPEGKQASLVGTAGTLASLMGLNTPSEDGVNYMLYPDVIYSSPFLMEFAPMVVEYKKQKITMEQYMTEEISSPWWSHIIALPGMVLSLFESEEEGDEVKTFENSPKLQQKFTKALKARINVELDEDNGTITINTTFQDPYITQVIADSIVVKLQRYMDDYYTASTRFSLQANVDALKVAKENYYKADEEFAAAVDRNHNLVSKSAALRVERLQNERNLAYQVYQQVALQVEATQVKLQEERIVATVIQPALFPITTSAPRKLLIIVLFTFLFGFVVASKLILKHIRESLNNETKQSE